MLTARCAPAFLLVAAVAVGDGRDERLSPKMKAEAALLRDQIRAEIAALGPHDWAGSYYCGDGLDFNESLDLAPQAGFVVERFGCMGCTDRNYGQVGVVDGQVHLDFTFEDEPGSHGHMAPVLLPIAWGERRYLIPPDDVLDFCNGVNLGSEPRIDRHGGALLRRGDEARHVSGWPALPAEFRDRLLPTPIDVVVTAVGDSDESCQGGGQRTTWVTIDAGGNRKLWAGMLLVVVEPERFCELLRLTTVDEQSAQGSLTQFMYDDTIPQVGWRLSTRLPGHPIAK